MLKKLNLTSLTFNLLNYCAKKKIKLNGSTSFFHLSCGMANSKFEYVRGFEDASDPILLKNCFVAIRVDGQRFHQFSKAHNFYKPNDKRALDLMVEAATSVMKSFYPSIKIAYGQSDEFSFIVSRSSDLYNRRANKLLSLIVSTFTSSYVFHWSKYLKDVVLKYPPAFDGRCVMYPSEKEIIDYLKWRQVDCHINNLYNTTFYCLTGEYHSCEVNENNETVFIPMQNPKPLSNFDAQVRLSGTVSSNKHDIMFLEHGVNYNNEREQFKKGSLLILERGDDSTSNVKKSSKKKSTKDPEDIKISCLNIDVVKSSFWEDNSYLLE
ncbi:tRNA(His) guanylyltransferase-like [Tetranychus urticae]|uniref:tRNA(His) guanylyltransferase n=1 Tax=Tetranychus urticae TaxID=32264 RepID=T1KYW0_TETUR|nr:tRNA(His) guanylyltransferase-like [Tetranychus urticae]